MQLRSGKQLRYSDVICESNIYSVYRLNDLRSSVNCVWFISKVQQTTDILKQYNKITPSKNIHNLYERCVEINTNIIENANKIGEINAETKSALIRLISEAYKLQLKLGRIIWSARQEQPISNPTGAEEYDVDTFYRCLKHIISDESTPHDYDMETYDDGEYTDVELWDYYYLDYATESDPYVINADTCFQDHIRFWNPMIIA